ncbi:MAG: hypothetical protein AVDCRST_MAG18-3509, partial [uncultured Thermomicrobiales bacterium]
WRKTRRARRRMPRRAISRSPIRCRKRSGIGPRSARSACRR